MKLLSINEFRKRQNCAKQEKGLQISHSTWNLDVIQKEILNKIRSKQLKEMANHSFSQRKFDDAEELYSRAIELNKGLRLLWTNRAACRNTMKKYNEAISDCDVALSIDPKSIRTIIQKGNSLLALNRFDEAQECYELLRALGETQSATFYMKKVHDIKDRIFIQESYRSGQILQPSKEFSFPQPFLLVSRNLYIQKICLQWETEILKSL